MQKNDIRKAGDYEITQAIYIGKKEIVLGENLSAKDGIYLVAYCETNGIFQRYTDCMISNDFIEVAELFTERLQQQVQQVKEEHSQIPVPISPIEWDQCIPMHECDDIKNQIVVVRPSVLRAEHRIATNQIYIAQSGNGIKAQGLGTAVYCDNLYDDTHTRFERYDFMGILKSEHYPKWLADKLEHIKMTRENPNVFEYGNKHFLPVGVLDKRMSLHEIMKHSITDKDMGFWCKAYERGFGAAKYAYHHKEFYAACGGIPCDIFQCLENRKFYMPAENELFEYKGKFQEYQEQGKRKHKSDKEMER